MSTIKDFENAPIGATATAPNGNTAFKTGKSMFEWSVYGPLGRLCECLSSDEMGGYTLNPAAPTTAREALELVWNLAHPIKEDQKVPIGTRCIAKVGDDDLRTYRTLKPFDWASMQGWAEVRTLDPLPEPDWLNAPAVLAATIFEDRSENRSVFVRENKDGTQWVRDTRFYRWDELIGVVPLYPKGQDA